MVEETTEKVPIPINYRRSVKSAMWPIIVFLCLKRKKRPNDLIDGILQAEYKKEITGNG